MEELQRLAGIVARVLKKPEDEVVAAVKSTETAEAIEQAFKDHIASVDKNAYGRAEVKIKKDTERSLTALGVKDASFDKLTEGIETLVQQARETGGSKLTDEEVLALPVVKRLVNTHITEKEQVAATAKADAEKALSKQTEDFRREQTNAKVEAEAGRIIEGLNPVFSQNPTVAANQRRNLLDQLKAGQYEVKDGQLLALKEDGTYRTDDLGHAVKFEDLVRRVVVDNVDLPAATPRDTAQLTQAQLDAARAGKPVLQHYKGKLPETKDEYLTLANDQSLPLAARQELKAAVPELSGE